MTTQDNDRQAYIDGLRALAAVLEQHPEVPLPYHGAADSYSPLLIGFYGSTAREQLAAAVRAMPCAWTKDVSGKWLNLNGHLAGLHLQMYAARDVVCTRRVTGVEDREVEEEVTPAVTRMVVKPVEVVTWDCGSLLAPAAAR